MSIDDVSIERLTKLIAGLADRVPAEVLLRAKTDVDYGEYGMALENLCQCMYDVNVKLNAVHIAAIERSAADFGLRRENWEFVERLVEEENPERD